jgi:hypothetical protein
LNLAEVLLVHPFRGEIPMIADSGADQAPWAHSRYGHWATGRYYRYRTETRLAPGAKLFTKTQGVVLVEPVRPVVWDLDETLWKGTLTEGGIEIIPANFALIRTLAERGVGGGEGGQAGDEIQQLEEWVEPSRNVMA